MPKLPEWQNKPIVKKWQKELNLSSRQMHQNKHVILEALAEQSTSEKTAWVPHLQLGADGYLYKSYLPSSKQTSLAFVNNLVTQQITTINLALSFKDISKAPERQVLFNKINAFLKSMPILPKGFYLYGLPGRGKTFVFQCLANHLAKKGYTVAFVNTTDFAEHLKTTFNDPTDRLATAKIVNILKKATVLFLDDIGAEVINPWFRDGMLLPILSYRMNHERTTFFSSNYDYNRLQRVQKGPTTSFDPQGKAERLLERVKSLSIPLHLTGKNYRY